MWILIDNYDSFTYILHDYLLQTGNDCEVYRNDEITIEELKQKNPERIIISPGPETPAQAGICMDIIAAFYNSIPILGICLGHQAIGVHFGAELIKAPYPMHGKNSDIKYTEHTVFAGIDATFSVMRYHSLVITNIENTGLRTIATSIDDNTIMAIMHEDYPCIGLQFHPESIGTNVGLKILQNWANIF